MRKTVVAAGHGGCRGPEVLAVQDLAVQNLVLPRPGPQQAPEAHRHLQAGHAHGKVILVP
jgi:hypothetical protein